MSPSITVDDLIIEWPEEGDLVVDEAFIDEPRMTLNDSWETSIRIGIEQAPEDAFLLAGATDPTKLAIQIEVLDNSGTLRSDAKGALPILNDAGQTVGVISPAGSLALPVGSTASVDQARADRPIRLQVKRRRKETICIYSKVWHTRICRTRWVVRPIGKPQEWLGPGDALPAGRSLILKSNGSLGF